MRDDQNRIMFHSTEGTQEGRLKVVALFQECHLQFVVKYHSIVVL